MVCLLSGMAVKLFFNHLHPQFLVHTALYWVHRLSGACLLLLPTWVAWRHSHDLSLYLYNVKRAWTWTRDDLKWLALAGPAAMSRRISLPEQHKFNAGEKLNFMALTLTYPVLVASGLVILLPGMYFLTWIVHVSVAVLAAPLIFGHVFMAVVTPDTRIGLSGMFSGNVDREWAKHHYAKWYRENFGEDDAAGAAGEENLAALEGHALLRCRSCGAETCLTSWDALLASVAELRPLDCPACGASSPVVSAVVKPEEIGSFLESLERAGATGPRRHAPPEDDLSPAASSGGAAIPAFPPCPESA
jgi:formate dehydrogenase subunit gamma